MRSIGSSDGIRSTNQLVGTRATLMGSLHLTVGVASAMAAAPAVAQQAGTSGDIDLPTVQVQGGTGGFVADTVGVTRLPVPIFDMPQQVEVVTHEMIQQQQTTTMEQALRNISGITFSAGEAGQQGDSPIIRGFSGRGDIFRDGIRDTGWYTRDMFDIEAVDVFLGPSSFAFGRGSTGGVINLVSKLPKDANFATADVTGYTSQGLRTTLDANGQVNDKVSARINAMVQSVDTADRDNITASRWGIAPSVSVKLDDRTKMTASYYYQHEDGVPDYGINYLPAPTLSTSPGTFGQRVGGYYGNGAPTPPVPVPRNTWYGVLNGPLNDQVITDTSIATLQFEREINDFVTVTNGTRYVVSDRMARPAAPRSVGDAGNTVFPSPLPSVDVGYSVAQMTVGQQRYQIQTDNTQLNNLTDMVAKFKWGTFEHTLNAGIELDNETRSQQRVNFCNQASPLCRVSLINPSNSSPNNGVGGFPSYFPSSNSTDMADVALYAADQIKLNQYWQIMGGFRWDNATTDYNALTVTNNGPATSTASAQTLSSSDLMLNYKVGVVFSPVETVNLYVTYGTSSNPSSEFGVLDTGTVTLAPVSNTTAEAGFKAQLLDNHFVVSGSLFQTIQTNTRVPTDPSSSLPPMVLGGEQEVQGLSLSAAGALTAQWNLSASYTYMESEILSAGPAPTLASLVTVGKQLPNTPNNSLSVWTSYALTPQLTLGAGAVYNSSAYVNTTNTSYVPSYWTFDAMASYQFNDHFQVQLNVYNLTDEYYIAQYFGGSAVPAAGRYATLTARATF
ncbi:TonB-dependent siderophore receptor [Aquabacter sp. CN5-332]|uniref:TonB-dependent receptor n=1 Tax=Aquabacter sp. CN5-332 TaxID=3156608 RepID=UPI0032B407FA